MKKVKNIFGDYRKELIFLTITSLCICLLSLIIPLISQYMFDKGVLQQNVNILFGTIITLLIINIITSSIEIFQSYMETKIRSDIEKRLKLKVLEHSFRLKAKHYHDVGCYKIISDALYSVDNILEIFSENFMTVFVLLFKTVGACLGLFLLSWHLALIVIAFVPLKYFLSLIFGRKTRNYMQSQIQIFQKFNSWIEEIIDGIIDIKVWGLRKIKLTEVGQIFEEMKNIEIKRRRLDEINSQATNNLDFTIDYFIYLIGVIMLAKLDLTIGSILAFVAYSGYLQNPLNVIFDLKVSIEKLKPAFKEIEDFFKLDTEEEKLIEKKIFPDDLHTIQFKNVNYCVNGKMILSHIDFCIHKHEKIAIVGENGSGKTTLLNLLLRLIDPTSGEILINENDIRSYDIDEYRKKINTVMQSVHLFSGTIEDNIYLGKNVKGAEDNIFAAEFIKKMREGLKTDVGISGAKLSGGERQKVGFLRAINRKAKILILDEATSNYDYQSERNFNEFIKHDKSFDFYFIVTHREEILSIMDKVLIIKNGTVQIKEK